MDPPDPPFGLGQSKPPSKSSSNLVGGTFLSQPPPGNSESQMKGGTAATNGSFTMANAPDTVLKYTLNSFGTETGTGQQSLQQAVHIPRQAPGQPLPSSNPRPVPKATAPGIANSTQSPGMPTISTNGTQEFGVYVPYMGLFTNIEGAADFMHEPVPGKGGNPDDPTIAKLERNPRPYVEKLCRAVTDMSEAKDNKTSVPYRRFASQHHFEEKEIESRCWILFYIIIDVSRSGVRRFWERESLRYKDRTEYKCKERFYAVYEVLRHQKTVCIDVMDGGAKVYAMVNAPKRFNDRKEANKKNNDRKKEVLNNARKGGEAVVLELESGSDDDSDMGADQNDTAMEVDRIGPSPIVHPNGSTPIEHPHDYEHIPDLDPSDRPNKLLRLEGEGQRALSVPPSDYMPIRANFSHLNLPAQRDRAMGMPTSAQHPSHAQFPAFGGGHRATSVSPYAQHFAPGEQRQLNFSLPGAQPPAASTRLGQNIAVPAPRHNGLSTLYGAVQTNTPEANGQRTTNNVENRFMLLTDSVGLATTPNQTSPPALPAEHGSSQVVDQEDSAMDVEQPDS